MSSRRNWTISRLNPAMSTLNCPANSMASLTYREQDVLVLLGRRYTNREIAEALVISPLTVRYHIENLSEKFGVRERRVNWDSLPRVNRLTFKYPQNLRIF